MSWVQRSVGLQSRVDWKPALGQGCTDPYLVWFDLLGFPRWLQRDEAPEGRSRPPVVPILIELDTPCAAQTLPAANIPRPYHQPLREGGSASRFVTGRATPREIAKLMGAPHVRRVQIDMSRTAPEPGPTAVLGRGRVAPPAAVWVGIIDDGCAFAHRSFRAAGRSRVEYFWDQNPLDDPLCAPLPWTGSTGFGYGRELRPSKLELDREDEAAVYMQLKYRRPGQSRVCHGTAVMDLAAGRPAPLPRQLEAMADLPDDAAGKAPIVFVELPHVDERDTCSTSLGVHLLDALRYMIDRVERHASNGLSVDPSQRLVVNISYGALAGPHDGTTIIEQAIDELIEKRGNLAVVMAAGNTFQRPPPVRPTHAAMKLAPGQSRAVAWRVQPDDITDSYLEIWFAGGDASPGMRVTVTPPGGSAQQVQPGESWTWTVGDEAVAGVVFPARVPQSTKATMALVAIVPTVPRRGHRAAPEGPWLVEVENGSTRDDVEVHLWIERDDLVAGALRRRQQSYLESRGGQPVDVGWSLSSLTHGRHTVVAGGLRLSDSVLASDSACGPAVSPARQRPDVLAPSSLAANAVGLKVAGTTTGVVAAFSGTSAAAASVSRWIANAFAAAPPGRITAAAVRTAIEMAKNHSIACGTGDDVYRDAEVHLDADLRPDLVIRLEP
jgi:hypothetical protein